MDIKFNINRIHSDLQNLYGEVKITEEANDKIGQYFQMEIIHEGKLCRVILTKESISHAQFEWVYQANPLNESSDLIQRTSNIYDFADHISDIFEKNRFNVEYLQQINN